MKQIHGEFNIKIEMDGPGGIISPPKKSKPASEASSSGLKPGPKPKPYSLKSESAQYAEAASVAKGRDYNALYHATYSKIKRADPDKSYVMRKMKKKPGLATEIRKWYQKFKKNKGRLGINHTETSCMFEKYIFCFW